MYLEGEFGNDPEDVNAYAISSFYAIDRYASYVKNWKKLWTKDIVFIADRYVDSNAIYQMTKLPQNEWKEFIEWLHEYEHNLLTLPKPTKTFFLDIPQNISDQLIMKRYQGDERKKDIHDKDILFQQKCRDTVLYCASNLNWITINCCNNDKIRSIEEINNDIFKYIMEDLKNDIKN